MIYDRRIHLSSAVSDTWTERSESSLDELEYAFRIFGNEAILDKIREIGDNFYRELVTG